MFAASSPMMDFYHHLWFMVCNVFQGGFRGEGDDIVKQAQNSTEGFTIVLAGLKALLEHNTILNLVVDRFPKGTESELNYY